MKRIWFCIGIILIACVGWTIFRVYPRHISLSLKGVEYQLGSQKRDVKPITLQLNGTLHTSLLGKRRFHGTVNISGATVANQDNGKTLDIVFNSDTLSGGMMTYFSWKTMKSYDYGSVFTNRSFNEFTIEEFQPEEAGGGWNGGDGLMISAPAKTRAEALRISNELMKHALRKDYVLK